MNARELVELLTHDDAEMLEARPVDALVTGGISSIDADGDVAQEVCGPGKRFCLGGPRALEDGRLVCLVWPLGPLRPETVG